MLNQLRQKIDQNISSFLDYAEQEYPMHLVNPLLYRCIREFSLREGKRIRPILFILSYQGYLASPKRVPASLYRASTCIEFLHNFMLIHDDIIDSSDLRRGKPTMHRLLENITPCSNKNKLGTDLAIIAGDIVYALAIDAFLAINENPIRKQQALKYFIQTAAFTALGEFVDTLHGIDALKNVTEKDVYLNYSLKTARYTFDCPLVTGAILAGAPQREIKLLSAFGLSMGQAFQIQDDIIGIFQTEKEIGKSILSDLEEQKKTLLIVHAFNTLKGTRQRTFIKLFTKPNKKISDLKAMRAMLIDSGSLAYALMAVKDRLTEADHILKQLCMKKAYCQVIKKSLFKFFKQSQDVAQHHKINMTFCS